MSNNLVKDLELVLIDRKGNAFFETVHHVGWVLNETKDWVLLITEFYEDPDDLERCTIGGLHRIKKDDIKYRRPIDQAVNKDFVNPFEHAGGGVKPIPEPEPKYIPVRQAEELSRVKNYVHEQLRKGDGGKVYHEENTPMNPEYDREAVRQVGIKRDEAAKKEIREKEMRNQQEKFEKWWLNRIPVEINGQPVNEKRYKIAKVVFRDVYMCVIVMLEDLSLYDVYPCRGCRYPSKSSVKTL